jgi:superfamily II DNA or RNA helicase
MMIDAGRLCDYRLNVPVFDVGATNTDLARFLVRNYRSLLVYCSTRAEGVSFCAAMNESGPCARYVDCDTPRGERREILEAFKSGMLAFVVNVRVLSVGFDAPITKGVCFVTMPASQTQIVQVIGRCLRVHPDKRCAQVILPLVAGAEGEDKRARDFMRVLAQTDSRVAQALRNRGAPYVSVRRVRRETAPSADGSGGSEEDEQNEQNAADLLYTAVYDATGTVLTDAWTTRFAELVAFYVANRTLPPQSTLGGLGSWPINRFWFFCEA